MSQETECHKKPALERTFDHGRFVRHASNRDFTEKPRLRESMRAHGFMPSSPIHVATIHGSTKLAVIRGHHRLHYAKELKLPVYYVVDDSVTNIRLIEGIGGEEWKLKDFVHSSVADGVNDYEALRDFSANHKLSLTVAASLLAGQTVASADMNNDIRDGVFAINSGEIYHAKLVTEITDFLVGRKVKFAVKRSFVGALSNALRVPEVEFDRLLSQVKKHWEMLSNKATIDDFLSDIERVYNYQIRGGRLNIKFRAKEELKLRVSSKRKTSEV